MNTIHTNSARYPNAVSGSYFFQKFADGLLCFASGVGIFTAFFFLLTM